MCPSNKADNINAMQVRKKINMKPALAVAIPIAVIYKPMLFQYTIKC